ncbi:MAG: polysaccharide biosynthesis/export family protein [Vicinamibacterales bacterium]
MITSLRPSFGWLSTAAVVAVAAIGGAVRVQTMQAQAAPAPGAVPKPQADLPSDYVIGADDVLSVVFWKDPDMSAEVTVRPDGIITLPLIGDLRVAGITPDALKQQVQKDATKYVTDPNVTVIVKQVNSRRVFITGQVTRPGEYPLTGTRTVMQLIALAGGLTEYADAKNIKIMRTTQGQQFVLPFNYREVERGQNLSQNVQLQPGDTLIVP